MIDFWRRLRLQEKKAQEELYGHATRACPAVWGRRGVAAARHQDLVHDVFVSVMAYAGRHAEPPENLPAFLKAWALDALTRGRRTPEPCADIDPRAPGHGPVDHANQAELLRAIRDCADRLEGVRKEAFILYYIRRLERAVAAGRAGVNVNAFSVRVFHANAEMRACLERKGFRP